jgi:hypothetical protein
MDGRFEDYTLGRNISMERVKEIYKLFKLHGFELAGLRSFDEYITDENAARRRALVAELRADPARLARVKAEASAKLARMPKMAKGVREPAFAGVMRQARDLLAHALMALSQRRGPPEAHSVQEEAHR